MSSSIDLDSDVIPNLMEFVGYCETLDIFHTTVLFRGQGRRGELLPGIARKQPQRNTTELERKVLHQFRTQGASLLGTGHPLLLEKLVLAQHFGLKTRLLDWTTNPLAALWFACSSRAEDDVYVYVLLADDFQLDDIYEEDPFTHSDTLVFQPRLDNPRVLAQNGWFTLHRYSQGSGKFIALEHQVRMKPVLKEIIIPATARSYILSNLSRMGIHHRSLFPDLTGLAEHLNRSYAL